MNKKLTKNIRNDPFISGLLKRIPKETHDTFSDEQLETLKIALGSREWGIHPIDFRGTIKSWSWRYYYVFLAGRNKRSLTARKMKTLRAAEGFFLLGFFSFFTLLSLLVLYLVKSFLGINIVPGFSLGVWDWFIK